MKKKASKTTNGFPNGETPPYYLHQRFKKIIPELFPCGARIYHYTSAEVLTKLAEDNAAFYATHYLALNDNEEYDRGIRFVLDEYLPKRCRSVNCLLHKELRELYKENKKKDELPKVWFLHTPWVVSFSRQSDLLSQWVSYTDKGAGGVAIGYDFDKLEEVVGMTVRAKRARSRFDDSSLDYEVQFLPCIYLDKKNPGRMRIVYKVLDLLFKDYFVRKANDFIKPKEKAILAVAIVNLFGAIAKHPSFASEDEFRLVVLVGNKRFLKRGEFIGGKPRIRVPLREETAVRINALISDVCLSPHGDQGLLNDIANFAKFKNDLKFEVRKSTSSYNGR